MSVFAPLRQLLMLLLVLFSPLLRAETSQSLDRNPVMVGETFTLEIITDLRDADEPDMRWPDGIKLLHRSNVSTQAIINGAISRSQKWVYKLRAAQAGDYTFAEVLVGKDRSNRLLLTVLPARQHDTPASASKLALRADVDKREVAEQEQVILTITLWRAIPVRYARLTEPAPPDTVVQLLGQDKEYETQLNGQAFFVLERRYALFPQKAGTVHIAPLEFSGDIETTRQSALYGAYADTEPVHLQTADIALTVQAAKPLMTAKSVQLTLSDLSSTVVEAGDPITFTLTTDVDAQLSSNLPDIRIPDSTNYRIYPDKSSDETSINDQGWHVKRVQKFAVVSSRVGELTLPPVEVHWFNTLTQKDEISRVTFPVIRVRGAAAANTAMPVAPVIEPALNTATAMEIPPQTNDAHSVWRNVSLLLGLLWLSTLLLWWFVSKKITRTVIQKSHDKQNDAPSTRSLKKQLLTACDGQDPYTAQQLLLHWARHVSDDNTLNWSQLLQRTAPDNAALHALDAALYGPPPSHWNGDALQATLDHIERRLQSSPDSPAALPPLNP